MRGVTSLPLTLSHWRMRVELREGAAVQRMRRPLGQLDIASYRINARLSSVKKLCIFVGTTVGGYAGWALGEGLGFELVGAFVISGVGSIVGVYVGWKVAEKIEE